MKIIAPAKVNLALHILGKRADGFHLLSSIVGFTKFGDEILIRDGVDTSIVFTGRFATGLDPRNNSIAKALAWFSAQTGLDPKFTITIEKNIPVEAGLGGGTADAAAIIRFLYDYYECPYPQPSQLLPLGADVPVSFFGQPAHMRGIGEEITPTQFAEGWGVVLCNPGSRVSTGVIFKAMQNFDDDIPTRAIWTLDALGATTNSMTTAAIKLAPEIRRRQSVLKALGAPFVRMSGSGATVFAICDNPKEVATAYQNQFPRDWVQASYFRRSTT